MLREWLPTMRQAFPSSISAATPWRFNGIRSAGRGPHVTPHRRWCMGSRSFARRNRISACTGRQDAYVCKSGRTNIRCRKTRLESHVAADSQAAAFAGTSRLSRAPAACSIATSIGPLSTTTSFGGWRPRPRTLTGVSRVRGNGRKVSPRRRCGRTSVSFSAAASRQVRARSNGATARHSNYPGKYS